MSKEIIAKLLKMYRESAGLTADEVGKAIGKSGKTVNGWEHGRGQPDADTFILLCRLYSVPSIGVFFGENLNEIHKSLSDHEYAIIEAYRVANSDDQNIVDSALRKYIHEGILSPPCVGEEAIL